MTKRVLMTPDDKPGRDYVCAKCTNHHPRVRLWRETHDAGDLLCADHATAKERKAGRKLKDEPGDDCIGYMLPARPHPDGDTFWGHTSGDVEWWYALPKYPDLPRELDHLKAERNRFVEEMLASMRSRHEITVEVLELRHALKVERQSKVPENAKRWRKALEKIERVQLDDVGTNTKDYTTEESLKMRLVAAEALR